MNGHRLRVWVGRDGIMSVSCFSVSIFIGLKFEEEINKMLHLEHGFVWC